MSLKEMAIFILAKVKIMSALEQAMKAQTGKMVVRLFKFGATWVWVVNATLRPLVLRKQTRYPFYRRLSGPQGRSGRLFCY